MAKIGYARVSTVDQNPDSQHDALTKDGCDRIFEDRASGTLKSRPELDRMMTEYLRKGDTLVVWKLDRLGRSLRNLLDVLEYLDNNEIGFRSISDGIDTTTPAGRMVFSMIGAMAQFESDLIQERTQAGLKAARARGIKGGRRPVMTEAQIKVAQQMYDDETHTVQEIADQLGVSRATIYRNLALKTSPKGQGAPEAEAA